VNKKDLKRFEKRLLEERERLLQNMAHLENRVLNKNQKDSSGDLSSYSFHMADLATDASEREKAFLFASKEGRLLYHIDEALRRLYRNEYGVCQTCGESISKERLEAVPHARLCIQCKEAEEKAKQRR
jgi:DnaK suppressor protein